MDFVTKCCTSRLVGKECLTLPVLSDGDVDCFEIGFRISSRSSKRNAKNILLKSRVDFWAREDSHLPVVNSVSLF